MTVAVSARIIRGSTPSPDGCWLWEGSLDRYGYGRMRVGPRNTLAYRSAYEAFVGPVPDELQLDHLCRNRRCVNPAHLEPVTAAENQRRGYWGLKTECSNGHPYTPSNTYLRKGTGRRACRTCVAAWQRAYQKRKKAAA